MTKSVWAKVSWSSHNKPEWLYLFTLLNSGLNQSQSYEYFNMHNLSASCVGLKSCLNFCLRCIYICEFRTRFCFKLARFFKKYFKNMLAQCEIAHEICKCKWSIKVLLLWQTLLPPHPHPKEKRNCPQCSKNLLLSILLCFLIKA